MGKCAFVLTCVVVVMILLQAGLAWQTWLCKERMCARKGSATDNLFKKVGPYGRLVVTGCSKKEFSKGSD